MKSKKSNVDLELTIKALEERIKVLESMPHIQVIPYPVPQYIPSYPIYINPPIYIQQPNFNPFHNQPMCQGTQTYQYLQTGNFA